jgi:ligand-binding SRPBCC domain-containing protein
VKKGRSETTEGPVKIYELNCEQLFPRGIAETFEFFKDPRNLSRITPPWLDFSIHTENPVMQVGARIDYTINWQGVPLRWKTIISEYEPPFHFVDVQLQGPYRYWEHTHSFQPSEDGTLVTDTVRYVLPFGLLGRIAHTTIVRRQLAAIFRFRQQVLMELLGGEALGHPVIGPAVV